MSPSREMAVVKPSRSDVKKSAQARFKAGVKVSPRVGERAAADSAARNTAAVRKAGQQLLLSGEGDGAAVSPYC